MGGQARRTWSYNSHSSIALVGLQGAGKRSLGFIAASHLRRKLVLACTHFEQATGLSKASYLRTHGRQAFYSRSLELLREMLTQHGEDCVIVCGVASLVPGASKLISEFATSHPVIEIRRDPEHILKENPIPEAERLHELCSNFEFFNLDQSDASTSIGPGPNAFALRKVKADLEAFLDFVIPRSATKTSDHFSLQAVSLERRCHSCVTTLRLSDLLLGKAQLQHDNMVEDAVELRVDCWDDQIRRDLSQYISILRRVMERPLLMSFEVQGSNRLHLDNEAYLRALLHGVRVGADYLVINTDLAEESQLHLLYRRGSTRLIAHCHYENSGNGGWLEPARIGSCKKAQDLGYDAIRLTQPARRQKDNHYARHFLQKVTATDDLSIPVSAYNLGPLGKASKIANAVLSPVRLIQTDISSEDTTSNEGITVADIVHARFACYEYEPLKFWVLGTHVVVSRTPAINNAAYKFYGMQHSFDRRHVSTWEQVLAIAQDPSFGGAALTAPFKQQALHACVSTSSHASAIGAVNTILPLRELDDIESGSLAAQASQRNRTGPVIGLYGDNTDWAGIYISIRRRLSPRNAATIEQSTGVVLGAGGSARAAVYALMRCRMHTICVYNRTHENAVRLAEDFRLWGSRNGYQSQFQVHSSWTDIMNRPSVIVSCVPSGTTELPDEMFDNPSGGIVVDLCYSPPNAFLHEQVERVRRGKQLAWEVIDGLDVLLQSGMRQFEQMTGYRAPRAVMERAIEDMSV